MSRAAIRRLVAHNVLSANGDHSDPAPRLVVEASREDRDTEFRQITPLLELVSALDSKGSSQAARLNNVLEWLVVVLDKTW